MADNDKKEFTSIEQLLMERERLDQVLDKQFRKELTIVFTDIKGSTRFFESRGDIEGLSMIRKHNEMHFPTIEAHGGRVVKTIGDAIMAVFEDPASAVRATIEMQNNLMYYNKSKPTADQIHIRIGLNHGVALAKEDDVFGDAVNLAARVESLAEADEILIADNVYMAVKDSDDIICRFHTKAQVKGKTEDIKIYRVVWSEEQLVAESQYKKTGTRRAVPSQEERRSVFEINASLEGDHLKLSSFERVRGEERTIHHYVDLKISLEEISRLCREVTSLLNRANKRGRVSKEILKQLEAAGQMLHDAVLTDDAKQKLRKTSALDLIVRMDDNLVHIPWELLYNGEQFLCQRFSMGRIVSTRQTVSESVSRHIARPLKMLILADPRGDLPMSSDEGKKIRDELDPESDLINANLRARDVNVDFVKRKIRDFDVLHYAGHADYDSKDPAKSGWLLTDGKFTSSDVRAMAGGGKPLPALVFSNGCQSGHSDQWQVKENYEEEIFGLANAFLLAGVQHYIGTFWDILDTPGADFALAFYREMMEGQSVGEAVRRARMDLIDKYGEDTIVWASYMLYGDPTFRYLEATPEEIADNAAAAAETTRPEAQAAISGAMRGAGAAGAIPARPGGISFTSISIGILAIVVVGILVTFAWNKFQSGGTVKVAGGASAYEKAFALLQNGKSSEAEQAFLLLAQDQGGAAQGDEGLAAVYFETGKLDQAKQKAAQAIQQDPNRMYARVVLGKIAVAGQQMEEARDQFLQASRSQNGLDWQRAVAFNELGRVYAALNDNQGAIHSYTEAAKLNPNMVEARANEGALLARAGRYDEARVALETAGKINPNDAMVATLLNDVISRQQLAQDAQRQAQLRETINDLIARAERNPPAVAPAQDEWTSRPLTITFLGLRSAGVIPGREGEDEFLLLKITQAFQADKRIEVVDRSMIDALLNELKLSSSDLADKNTALKLGRLLSARLIATGSIIRDADSVQISIQVIETETSQVKVAIAEPLDRKLSQPQIADKISELLLKAIKKQFPVRGEVSKVEGKTLILNLGSNVGLAAGTKLNLVDPRLTGDERILGTIEVTEVRATDATATSGNSKLRILSGVKVEETQ